MHAIPGAVDVTADNAPPEAVLGPQEPALRQRSAIETVCYPCAADHIATMWLQCMTSAIFGEVTVEMR